MSLFNNAIIGASSQGGYQISRSVRLRSSATAYLNRTPPSGSGGQSYTLSMWIKRGTLGTVQALCSANFTNSVFFDVIFNTGNTLEIYLNAGAGSEGFISTSVHRDPSAWYHIVIAGDHTNATAANRLRVYVNNVPATGTYTYPSTGFSTSWNIGTRVHGIGVRPNATYQWYFDGLLAEFHSVDGQTLTPSSFGETDSVTGVWKPKKYTGTYGTNGFYLNFADNSGATSTTIGKDSSGNGNNWTPNNISVTAGVTNDSMIDVPTLYADGSNGRGNYCTLNPLYKGSNVTPTEGNLKFVITSGNFHEGVTGTIFPTSGKWYAEFLWNTVSAATSATAVCRNNAPMVTGPCAFQNTVDTNSPTYRSYVVNGNKDTNTTTAAYGSTYTAADLIGVALDLDNGKVWFSKNGVWQASGDPAAGTNAAFTDITGSDGWTFAVSGYGSGGDNCHANFGQRPFTYTPPTGFKALNTQNLPDAPIKKGNQHFDVVTSTATVSTGITISSLAFSPGLMWRKNRNNVESHYWVDAVRGTGAGGFLVGNSTAAATGYPNSDGTLTFNSNGYTIAETNWGAGEFYFNSRTYVDWMWNAGSSTVTNTDGTISAQVRANPTSGFSIVTYTGTGAAATIGHGLGVAPRMIIVFERSPAGDDHIVYHANLTSNQYSIRLNTTAAQAGPSGAYWNSASPTSTVFSVGTSGESNQSTATYVAYCFAPVAGYSAFGSYTGNGSADGPFVFTGFRPRFVMIRAFSTGLRDWLIYDTSTSNPNNPGSDGPLVAASTDVTSYDGVAYTSFDILSNGFKVRAATTNLNASGESHLFMAFAENPFKHSLAR
jgi:hypothetical protein